MTDIVELCRSVPKELVWANPDEKNWYFGWKWLREAADEIERLRAALAVIYRAHEKVLDEGDAWFITDDTTVGYYICSVLGAPPEEKE